MMLVFLGFTKVNSLFLSSRLPPLCTTSLLPIGHPWLPPPSLLSPPAANCAIHRPGASTYPTALGDVMPTPPSPPDPSPPLQFVSLPTPCLDLIRSISTFKILATSTTLPSTICGLGDCPICIAVRAHCGKLSAMCCMLLSGEAFGDIQVTTAGVQGHCSNTGSFVCSVLSS